MDVIIEGLISTDPIELETPKKSKYQAWIDEHYPDKEVAFRACKEACEDMLKEFPELRRVKGHYRCMATDLEWPHWWLETTDGEVIDPTAAQFTFQGGIYEEHIGEEPTGKCLNCGAYCYRDNYFCCDECAKQTEEFMNRSVQKDKLKCSM